MSPGPRARPSQLQPPATIVSPPSPIDTKDTPSPAFAYPPKKDTLSAPTTEEPVQYDSPEEDEENTEPKPDYEAKGPSDSLGPAPTSGVLSSHLSASPRKDYTMHLPDSPGPSRTPSRPVSPSSAQYHRPRGLHHRRTSSTHRVRETTDGQQSNTEDGERMINQYRIGKSLGKGAFASVELGIDVGTGVEYLVHLYEAISVPTADALFLVLEYLPGGTLMQIEVGQDDSHAASPLSVEQTREYFRQLCLGLEYLHSNEVVHRDIKPDNILLSADRQVVKLCDFGVSEMFAAGDDRIKKSGGSPAFLSPESFTAPSQHLHGVTLYCMLTGRLPFNVPNPMELFTAVREKTPLIPKEWEDVQQDLLRKMLEKDPHKRIAMPELREHPWVTNHGNEPMIDTNENLYEIGKQVEEPTQQELRDAIGTLRGIFTVIRAVQKRSASGHGPPSPGSTNVSLASGSMDSYVSQEPGTDATSVSDETEEANSPDDGGEDTGSKEKNEPSPHKDDDKPFSKQDAVTPIRTDVKTSIASAEERESDDAGDGVVLMDSPVSEDDGAEQGVTIMDSPVSDNGESADTPVCER
ncbi:hypothetical protein IAU60_001118 [Kwoniella sp. DSM 27419]